MRRRGHSEDLINKVVLENPREFLSQSPKFNLAETLPTLRLNS